MKTNSIVSLRKQYLSYNPGLSQKDNLIRKEILWNHMKWWERLFLKDPYSTKESI